MATAKRYRILAPSIDYPDGQGGMKTAMQGDVVTDLPKAATWLIKQGHVVEETAARAAKAKAVAAESADDAEGDA